MSRAHAKAPAHAAPATHHGHAYAEPVSEFAALLGQPLAAAPVVEQPAAEPSLFDGLLAGTLGSGKRRRLVVCGLCGWPGCTFSRYVDE